MGYQDSVQVTLSIRSTQYAIKMSSAGDELWLGISCSFTQWQPPNNDAAYTFAYDYNGNRMRDSNEEQVRAHSWMQYQQEWDRFKSQFVSKVIDAWDNKLVLKHSSSASSNSGSQTGISQFPDIRCRLHAWEQPQNARCSCLVVRAASRTSDRYAGRTRIRTNMGGPRADCSPWPDSRSILLEDGSQDGRYGNFNMFLSSNDVNRVDTGQGTHQVYVAHEMGHYLGLWHRCEIRPDDLESREDYDEHRSRREETIQPAPATAQETQFDGYHPRAAYDQSQRTQDAYCGGSSNRGAVTDLMAFGMDVNPWHGFAWHDALQRVTRGPGGHDYRRTSWVVEPA